MRADIGALRDTVISDSVAIKGDAATYTVAIWTDIYCNG